MTKDEAAVLLGVGVGATASEVRERYRELHNEYQIRLTNAPTPALKKVYQRNLQELQDAAETLSPNAVTSVPDLPAAEPVHSSDAGPRPARPAPASHGRPARVEPPADHGLPRSTMIAGVVAALCAGVAALLGVLWMQSQQGHQKLATELAASQARVAQLELAVAEAGRLLKGGPLEV